MQVVDLEEDITFILGDVADLDQDVNFLFDEQVIQDERLFSLEQTVFVIDEEVEGKLWYVSLIKNNKPPNHWFSTPIM